jgi:GntR family transcriptional regulator/MocR family aminotransferase
MSMTRRMALLEFARERDTVLIEDDYDCEFRFDGRPLDALQTIDRHESVFYVGTFSKSLFPQIRKLRKASVRNASPALRSASP